MHLILFHFISHLCELFKYIHLPTRHRFTEIQAATQRFTTVFIVLQKQVWVLLTPPHKVGNPATFLTWGIRAACFYPPYSAVREQHANREQRVLETRENLSSCHIIIAWPCSNQATRVGGICGRGEILFGYWRRGRWRMVGERGDRTRHSAARPGNTIKLSADPLSLTYNTSLSLFLNLSPSQNTTIYLLWPFAKTWIPFQKVTNTMTFSGHISEQKTAETAIT